MYNLAGKKLKGDKVKGAADPAGTISEKTKNQKYSPWRLYSSRVSSWKSDEPTSEPTLYSIYVSTGTLSFFKFLTK
jgi:hypothetical protein